MLPMQQGIASDEERVTSNMLLGIGLKGSMRQVSTTKTRQQRQQLHQCQQPQQLLPPAVAAVHVAACGTPVSSIRPSRSKMYACGCMSAAAAPEALQTAQQQCTHICGLHSTHVDNCTMSSIS
jgi:hypothetical protein